MMRYPNLREEKRLWRKGYKKVVGLDEAGRGSLAASVLAAAVMVSSDFSFKNSKLLREVKDSKKLSAKKREKIYRVLVNCPRIEWGIGRVSEKVIDKINILEATKLAAKRALKNLENKIREHNFRDCRKQGIVDFLILDGNFKLDLPISQKSIIKADNKVFSCAAASIIAKVRRDRLMVRYHKKYPQYGFNHHKGYPTEYHKKMIKKYGPSKIHRKTFKGVK